MIRSLAVGVHSDVPMTIHMVTHIICAKIHPTMRWTIVSSSWSKNRHAGWCGNLLRCNLSEVQQRVLIVKQKIGTVVVPSIPCKLCVWLHLSSNKSKKICRISRSD